MAASPTVKRRQPPGHPPLTPLAALAAPRAAVVRSATSTSAPPRFKAHCAPSRPRPLERSPRPSARRLRRGWSCWCRSTARSPRSSTQWRSMLIATRTPRSCAVFPDLVRCSAPGCLANSQDDPNRFTDPRGRKAYAQIRPITKASGRSLVVLARVARNRRLADACEWWAFCSLGAIPGARRYYDALRARSKTHCQATRQLANPWVGILHACLERHEVYREQVARPEREEELGVTA